MASSAEDRILNPTGRRHYRRTYSVAEVRAGALVLAALGLLLGWVVWMGAHPDPGLFANADLLDPGAPVVERGVLPAELSPEGFSEGPIARFDADNLYEKINGRAGYFTSKGFEGLTFVALRSEQDEALGIDMELYDMGTPVNALGTYAGEKDAAIESTRAPSGLWHRDRNALYMAHGQYYVRAIGASEDDAVIAALEQLRQRLEAGLPAADAELPWAHALFEARGLSSGRVSFHKENAFSFSFANGVYSALLPDDETELFVVAAPDAAAAAALAARFIEGFASYGEVLEGEQGAAWVQDRYLSTLSSARAAGSFVCGVRAAPDRASAEQQLAPLCQALTELSPQLRAEALAELPARPEKNQQAAGDSEAPAPEAQAEDGYE